MDYFNDIFTNLNVVVALLCMQVQKAIGFYLKYLIFIPKMNEGLTGLEWHEGE